MAIFKGAKNRDDTFVGTDAADRFVFDPADLTRKDVVFGGDGPATDRLIFTAAGTISARSLAQVTGIEAIALADGGSSITLVQSLLDSASARTLSVTGGSGNDLIDGHLLTDENGAGDLKLLGGAGDDIIRGPNGNGLLQTMIDGGAGSDSIEASNAILAKIVYDGTDIKAFASQGTLIVKGSASIDLTHTRDQSADDACIMRGFASVDASASRTSVTIVGAGTGALIGGHAADIITGNGLVVGGGGADTLVGARFVINSGDFVAGESIVAVSGSASLTVYGDADFTKGTVIGINELSVNQDPAASQGAHLIFDDDQIANVHFVDGDRINSITVKVGSDHVANIDTLVSNGDIDIVGSSAADKISAADSSVVIHGLGGDDILYIDSPIREDSAVHGDDGDDQISGNVDGVHAMLDGGAGIDTLRLFGDAGEAVEIDLSRANNQGVSGTGILTGFENVDLIGLSTQYDAIVHGSSGANEIVGSFGETTIFGEAGDDVLKGGGDFGAVGLLYGDAGDDILFGTSENSHNVMTGGRGSDTFRWVGRSTWSVFDDFDEINDFRSGQDHLEFAKSHYGFSGDAFDERVVARNTSVDIAGADLVIYTGGIFDDVDDVVNYINQAKNGNESGFFVAGVDSDHHLVLYHTLGGYAYADNVTAIADLGVIKPTQLALTDFSFI